MSQETTDSADNLLASQLEDPAFVKPLEPDVFVDDGLADKSAKNVAGKEEGPPPKLQDAREVWVDHPSIVAQEERHPGSTRARGYKAEVFVLTDPDDLKRYNSRMSEATSVDRNPRISVISREQKFHAGKLFCVLEFSFIDYLKF